MRSPNFPLSFRPSLFLRSPCLTTFFPTGTQYSLHFTLIIPLSIGIRILFIAMPCSLRPYPDLKIWLHNSEPQSDRSKAETTGLAHSHMPHFDERFFHTLDTACFSLLPNLRLTVTYGPHPKISCATPRSATHAASRDWKACHVELNIGSLPF